MDLSDGTNKQQSPAVKWCYTSFILEQPIVPDELCKYRIEGREICPDTGRPHIQGYVEFKQKQRFTAITRLCKQANWAKAKGSPWSNFEYCSKEGAFQELGTRPKEPKEKDTTYADAIAAPTLKEGMEIVREKRPRDYALYGETIERNLKRLKRVPTRGAYSLQSFNHAPLILEKNTLLWGSSGTGKTQFALSHFKNPLLCSHIDKIKQLSPDNDGIVFDDMSFKHWPIEAVIHLLDEELDLLINVRYGTVNIPAKIRKIFTHNTPNPFYMDSACPEQIEAVERRFTRVHAINKLY
nr:rep protein [Cressdnaviricota sp.]